VLADLRIGAGSQGAPECQQERFMYVIDRTNGRLIAAHPFVRSTGSHVDLKTAARF